MIYKVSEILRDVRVCLDQNMTDEGLLSTGDIDTLTLDEIIRSKIEEGVERVERGAPPEYLEEGHNFGDAIYWRDRGRGWVILPDDFMRLITFRMSDWERAVFTAISASDATYGLQSSRYKGIRGNIQKPVCAIVNRPVGKVLEFYSCRSNSAYVEQASYLPYPRIDESDGIDICERCYRGVVYMIASLVLLTYGEIEKSRAIGETVKTFFE